MLGWTPAFRKRLVTHTGKAHVTLSSTSFVIFSSSSIFIHLTGHSSTHQSPLHIRRLESRATIDSCPNYDLSIRLFTHHTGPTSAYSPQSNTNDLQLTFLTTDFSLGSSTTSRRHSRLFARPRSIYARPSDRSNSLSNDLVLARKLLGF